MQLPKITQENVHIFIPLKVSKVVETEVDNKGIDIKEALLNFYNSKVYDILEQEDTKLWYESPNYLYMGWQMEQNGEELDI
ncbi:hypothetical protein [Clostridium sp.]|uniref:hypothetical protein n=1 Tax=Clostridium sp. TaxID=1506 RepID=UPI0032172F4D